MNKRGQSIIEYALITLLVILGIFFMGPYVLRSIDAHFKLWDEDVHDSFTENITQAPDSVIPPMPINCKCTNSPGTCGSTLIGSTCAAFQRFMNHTCSLQGCDGEPLTSCVDDPTCCTTAKVGCGTVPLDQSPTATNCNFGYRIEEQICGANSNIQCVPDGSCPLPACLGIITASFQACPNSPGTPGGPAVTQNYGIDLIDGLSNCTAGTPCQYFCAGLQLGSVCNPLYECSWVAPPIECLIAGTSYPLSWVDQGCIGQISLVNHCENYSGLNLERHGNPLGNSQTACYVTSNCREIGADKIYSCPAVIGTPYPGAFSQIQCLGQITSEPWTGSSGCPYMCYSPIPATSCIDYTNAGGFNVEWATANCPETSLKELSTISPLYSCPDIDDELNIPVGGTYNQGCIGFIGTSATCTNFAAPGGFEVGGGTGGSITHNCTQIR